MLVLFFSGCGLLKRYVCVFKVSVCLFVWLVGWLTVGVDVDVFFQGVGY